MNRNETTLAQNSRQSSVPEYRVIHGAADLWNVFLEVEGLQRNDVMVVNELIHRIQDMMYANLYIKEHGKL